MNTKIKLAFPSHDKLNFQPGTYNYSFNIDVNTSVLFNVNCSVF